MPEIKTVGIEEFMALRERLPVFDVRTPAEFAKGHIPGAFNLPLFSDEERRRVGIIYKQIGRESAILEGLEYVGPKMRRIVETVQSITGHKTLLLHCWRGGMRSSSVAWLLNTSGYEIFLLKGGYKAFRHYVLDSFEIPRDIIILSGHTGSGKTEILQALSRLGEQAIDLEKLACHKGSAFGSLGETPQPAQQEFENHLALFWRATDLPWTAIWSPSISRQRSTWSFGSGVRDSFVWPAGCKHIPRTKSCGYCLGRIPSKVRVAPRGRQAPSKAKGPKV